MRALTPLHTLSYSHAGRVVVGGSTVNGPACSYYFPNARGVLSSSDSTASARVGPNELIVNGTGNTQIFPSLNDMTTIGARIAAIDSNGTLGGGTGAATQFFTPSVKFWAGNYRATTKLVNQSNGQACVQVFTCTFRRDVGISQSNLRLMLIRALGEKLAPGDIADYTAILTSDPIRDDSLSPYDASKFCSYFRLSSRKMIINSGDIKVITHGSSGMKLVNPSTYTTLVNSTDVWTTNAGDIFGRKGAVFQFFRVTGQPTNDQNTKSLLGNTSPAIVFTHDYQFQYRFIVESGAVTTRLGNAGFGLVTTASVMEEQANVAAPGVNA